MHQITFKCDACSAEFSGETGQKPERVWKDAQQNGWRQREYTARSGRAFHRTCVDCTPPALARRKPAPLAPEIRSPSIAADMPHLTLEIASL